MRTPTLAKPISAQLTAQAPAAFQRGPASRNLFFKRLLKPTLLPAALLAATLLGSCDSSSVPYKPYVSKPVDTSHVVTSDTNKPVFGGPLKPGQPDAFGRPYQGNPAASVTILAFSDLGSWDCYQYNQVLAQVISDYSSKVRFSFFSAPVNRVNFDGEQVTHGLEVANERGLFWPYLNQLLRRIEFDSSIGHHPSLPFDQQLRAASLAGLDTAQFRKDWYNPQVDSTVDQMRSFIWGQVDGAYLPVLFINQRRVDGVQTAGRLRQIIDSLVH